MNISDIAIRRPVFTTMVMLAMMVVGVISFMRLGVDLFPDVSFPVVSITTVYPGASPEEVERSVTKQIEDAVFSIARVEKVHSFSREGVSQVIVVFEIGTDIDTVSLDVRDRVSTITRDLPNDAEDPIFLKFDPSASPVITLVLRGTAPAQAIRAKAMEDIKPRLEQVRGVAVVKVRGGAKREIQVDLDAQRLAAYQLTVAAVARAIGAENVDVPGGKLHEGEAETSIRIVGEIHDLRDLDDIIVGIKGGIPIRLRDVGVVRDTIAQQRTLVRVQGEEAVALEVIKQGGTNMVAVADGILAKLQDVRAQLPHGWKLELVTDSSSFIRDNAHQVEEELVVGGIAAIFVIFFFMMDWRSTFISALALPTSVISTFAMMYAVGFTLNMLTLLGLSLSIGLLIDDAIVVRENIFRHIEAGEHPMLAASRGTKEIALAVLATTFTILAVFVPVAFMGGMIGQFFKEFALTISAAVLVSLFVAFTLDPMLSARLVKAYDPDAEAKKSKIARAITAGLAKMDQVYVAALDTSLRHRFVVIGLSVVLFVASIGTVMLNGANFFPKPDRGEFTIGVTLPSGTSLTKASSVIGQIEDILQEDPAIALVYSTIGKRGEARQSTLRINTLPKQDRTRSLSQIMADLRASLGALPGVNYSLMAAGFTSGEQDLREAPISISVRGPDLNVLASLAAKIEHIARTTPGAVDIASTYSPGHPEIHAIVDRSATSQLGVPAGLIGATVRAGLVGVVPTTFRDGEREIDVRVQLDETDRASREAIAQLQIETPMGLVPLRQVATITQAASPATIERENRQRQITVAGNVSRRSLSEVMSDIEAQVTQIDFPDAYTWSIGGETKRMRETNRAFAIAMVLALIFVYIVLASQFESFIHPLTIMVSVPLAIIGALIALFLTGNTMGMSSMIGMILLMGLVTKNAILLIDLAITKRTEGLTPHQAIRFAGPQRLRPIIMTSLAMILGMLPSALSRGAGSEFRAPMAIAIIGGVITSTLLTLVVVPIFFLWFDRFAKYEKADTQSLLDPE